MDSNKYICIFGGGAIRGVAYIGAMRPLKELGIKTDTFIGSSVGAIIAAFCAIGYSSEEVRLILNEFNAFMFKDLNFSIGSDFSFSKGDVFEDWIRDNIEKKFYGEEYKKGENPPVIFKNLDKSLYICTTDLRTNSQFIFSKKETPDFEVAKAVRISAGFPGLMKPVEYENKFLVDGDLAKSLPLWKFDKDLLNTDNRILEFRLEGCRDCLNFKNVLEYFNSVYSTISNFSSEQIVETYQDKDNFDYIIIDTKDILLLDFQMPNEMRDKLAQNGYETTMKYFTETLVKKKRKLLPQYEKTLNAMLKLKPLIKYGKTDGARRTVLDFICETTSEYNNIDSVFLNDLIKFKASFLRDIKDYKFLPLHIIENKIEHTKVLQGLIERCENTINDLKNYIEKYSE